MRSSATTLPGAGNAAITKLRDEAIAAFAARGLPNRRVEEWKYTDLRSRDARGLRTGGYGRREG